MHVISLRKLKHFWLSHPTAEASLRYWYKLTVVHKWQCFNDIVQTFPTADKVKNFVVFNIGGNNFRLITYVDYAQSKIFIRDVLTHAEYDKENWKKDDWLLIPIIFLISIQQTLFVFILLIFYNLLQQFLP